MPGRRLAEGDPPLNLVVPDCVEMAKTLWQEHAEHWGYLRAFARDSNGRRYVSEWPTRRPFWGIGDGKVPMEIAEKIPALEIHCELERHVLEEGLYTGKWAIRPLKEILNVSLIRPEHESWRANCRGFPVEVETEGAYLPPRDS